MPWMPGGVCAGVSVLVTGLIGGGVRGGRIRATFSRLGIANRTSNPHNGDSAPFGLSAAHQLLPPGARRVWRPPLSPQRGPPHVRFQLASSRMRGSLPPS